MRKQQGWDHKTILALIFFAGWLTLAGVFLWVTDWPWYYAVPMAVVLVFAPGLGVRWH